MTLACSLLRLGLGADTSPNDPPNTKGAWDVRRRRIRKSYGVLSTYTECTMAMVEFVTYESSTMLGESTLGSDGNSDGKDAVARTHRDPGPRTTSEGRP